MHECTGKNNAKDPSATDRQGPNEQACLPHEHQMILKVLLQNGVMELPHILCPKN